MSIFPFWNFPQHIQRNIKESNTTNCNTNTCKHAILLSQYRSYGNSSPTLIGVGVSRIPFSRGRAIQRAKGGGSPLTTSRGWLLETIPSLHTLGGDLFGNSLSPRAFDWVMRKLGSGPETYKNNRRRNNTVCYSFDFAKMYYYTDVCEYIWM